ncbi:MAG: DNA mismatch repair endonuclease MutL [Candidatus Caenarcaniphilales bacterium]|jgi:DNA mismatch repair protein MutL|nr:DNA mismatch repair endonuclease MutL [Candidatus Caenarcaniphilales bacterium]
MSKIALLPEHIINQIAAGEVVEGPSSIIKELVENSIDAGSTRIEILLSKNLLHIEIADNGCGMSREDLEIAFKKHSTSKIKSTEDINKILTNGFRGEALASISAISKLTCISKKAEDQIASKIYLENGKQIISESGAQTGTRIVVDDLFFNTPARLKFLKSDNKEKNLVVDMVRALALANPKIAFTFKLDSKEILKTTGSADQAQTVLEVFGSDISLVKLNLQRGDITVSGWVSDRFYSRSDKRGIFTFLNNRVIQCYIMKSAIDSVYKDILGPSKYPIAVINLELPCEHVDVNVHPAKKEVRYQNTNAIYQAVGDSVAKALANSLYESNISFQINFQDTQMRELPVQASRQVEFITDVKSSRIETLAFQNLASPKPISEEISREFSFESRNFVSRLGSVDIDLVDSLSPREIITEHGNKTIFDLVVKNADINKSIVLKGQFIGENWIKDKYLGFLKSLGQEILDKKQLEIGFGAVKQRENSRPSSKPSKTQLEEIWQRDNYTCVYCSKSLIHPDQLNQMLVTAENPEELKSHLATYDHHLPASKYAELNKDSRNLFASCVACNLKKSDSLASKTWSPN